MKKNMKKMKMIKILYKLVDNLNYFKFNCFIIIKIEYFFFNQKT